MEVAALAILIAGAALAQQNPESQVTVVAPLIVTAGVPVPKVGQGAPLYTAPQIREKGYEARDVRTRADDAFFLDCAPPFKRPPTYWLRTYREAGDAARRVSVASRVAERATSKAQRTRIAATDHRATQAQVEADELARQAAVIELVKAELDFTEARAQLLDIQDLVNRQVDVADWPGELSAHSAARGDARATLAPKEYQDLALESVQVAEKQDGKAAPWFQVSGTILNTRPRAIATPPISITAVDMNGFPLGNDEAIGKGRIGPGETKRFTADFKPSPPHTAQLIVTFASARRPLHLEPARCLAPGYPDHSGNLAPLPMVRGAR